MRTPLELAAAVNASDPRATVTYLTMQALEGHTSTFFVRPLVDPASGRPFVLGYNQVFVDPVTAEVKGRRDSRAVSLSTRNLMPFLRRLHYTLHIPAFRGTDRWGYWLMGTIALVWLIDSFVGFYLTLPPRSRLPRAPGERSRFLGRWKPAWLIRRDAGRHRLNFDVHRAFGLWTWGIVFIVAFTSFSINLKNELFYPVMSLFSQVTPSITVQRPPAPIGTVIPAKVGMAAVVDVARAEARERGWHTPMGGLFYNVRTGVVRRYLATEEPRGKSGARA